MKLPKEHWANILLSFIGGSILVLAGAVINFYIEWKTDEATEDSIMFKDPKEKERVIKHVEDAVDPVEMKVKFTKDEILQERILEKLETLEKQSIKQDCLSVRLNDQYYQLNQKISNE